MRACAVEFENAQAGASRALLAGLWALALLSLSCGGSSGGGQRADAPGSANLQAYTLRWLQPSGASADGFELSMGTQSGIYDENREVNIQMGAVRVRADGTLSFEIRLDRGRDQFLRMRAYNAAGLSPPSNELRVPALGASTASAAATSESASEAAPAGGSSPTASSSSETATGTAQSPALAAQQSEASEDSAYEEPLRSLDLDGTDEYLASTGSAGLGGPGAFSVSLWALAGAGDARERGLLGFTCVDASCGIAVALLDADGGPLLELRVRGSTAGVASDRQVPAPVSAGSWWHLGLVLEPASGEARLFVNGVLVAHEVGIAFPPELASGASVRVALGAVDAAGASPWLGKVGHAALFDRALAPTEILEIARGGHALDLRWNTASYQGASALAHYWRLGASSAAVGRDSAASPLDLDDPAGNVDAADIANDAPNAVVALRARAFRLALRAPAGRG